MQLSDFNGRSLSSFNSSAVTNDPDVPEAGELRVWYSNAGGGSDFKSVSTRGGGGGTGDGERRAVMVFSKNCLKNEGARRSEVVVLPCCLTVCSGGVGWF